MFFNYFRKQWEEAEVACKSTRPFQTASLNTRKSGTVLCLWADLVLQPRPQAGLVVKFSNVFRSIGENRISHSKLSNPCKKYKD